MADNKFIMIGLDDERSKDLANILGNKTCKKILDYLSDIKEASEKDISDGLSIPINTVEYNLKKLIKSGLIERKNFFWSVKGRKIDMYRLSNKKIIISPKSFMKGILPALLGIGLISFGIKILTDRPESIADINTANIARDSEIAVSNAPMGKVAVQNFASSAQNICSNANSFYGEAWAWFLLGGLISILIFLLWNQFKKMKGGL